MNPRTMLLALAATLLAFGCLDTQERPVVDDPTTDAGSCATPCGEACCSGDEVCSASSTCCARACDGKSCGPDGCGGTCGQCTGGKQCDAQGQCVCQAKTCAQLGVACGTASDGCGKTLNCGGCGAGICQSGRCNMTGVTCVPSTQAPCGSGERCVRNSWVDYDETAPYCTPEIAGRACTIPPYGSAWDGCSSAGFACNDGHCQAFCLSATDCRSNETCVKYSSSEGYCEPRCTPAGNTGCYNGDRCTLQSSSGTLAAVCAKARLPAVGEGQRCSAMALGDDNCQAGQLCIGASSGNLCRSFCDAQHPCTKAGQVCTLFGSSSYSVCMAPCDVNRCSEPHESVCTPSGATAVCSCDPGYVESSGSCVDATPCTPNPCTALHETTCTDSNHQAVCSCDPGYAEDDSGSCRSSTPCSPNPCTEALKTVCAPNGFDYTCSCDAGALDLDGRCVAGCASGQHLDGDELEPNECAAQAAPITPTPAGTYPSYNAADISPATSDVDHYKVVGASGHAYWLLLEADARMCTGAPDAVDPAVSTTVPFAGQSAGALSFSCAQQAGQSANPSYRFAVLDFDLTDGDYADSFSSPTPLAAERRWAANDLGSSEFTDAFRFTVGQSIQIRHTGRSVGLRLWVKDPTTGATLTSTEATCLMSFTPVPCVSLTLNGTVRVDVEVTSEQQLQSGAPSLNAWHLAW